VENAIKHNEFSEINPLLIQIDISGNELIVHNNVRKKFPRKPSSKIGLRNLQERYRLVTSKQITVNQGANDFTVALPVLAIR
jgi:hypothetical protein